VRIRPYERWALAASRIAPLVARSLARAVPPAGGLAVAAMLILILHRAAQQGGGLGGGNHLQIRSREKGFLRAAGIFWSVRVASDRGLAATRAPAMQRATVPQCKALLWTRPLQ
jgi:hypothetical protein